MQGGKTLLKNGEMIAQTPYDVELNKDIYPEKELIQNVYNFLDNLSNWYVRRNRRRFWKSENDSDKNAAYFTLYTLLMNFINAVNIFLNM